MLMRKWFFMGFLMLLAAFSASATYISLATTVDLDKIVNATSPEANITIINEGDEPAYDVIVEPVSNQGLTAEQITMGNVNPNQTVVGTLKLNIPTDAIPGKYSMGLIIRYNDLNNYPFTFVTPLKFFYKTAVQSNVVGLLNEVELSGDEKKTLTLKLQNRDDKQHQLAIRLYTPNQIAVDGKERALTLAPSSETAVDFTVSSLGALPGGNFFVFAILDYDDDGKHYSVISGNGRILTAKERSYMGVLAPIIIVIVVVLVLLLIYLQLRQDKLVSPSKTKKAAPAKKK